MSKRIPQFLILIVVFVSCNNNHDKETYVLEEGFRGEVFVIYDNKYGEDIEYLEEGHRIYRIPSNGVLLTQFKTNDGPYLKSDKTFYIGSIDSVNMIPWFTHFDRIHRKDTLEISENSVYVDNLHAYISVGFRDTIKGEFLEFVYSTFVVGTKNNISRPSYDIRSLYYNGLITQ